MKKIKSQLTAKGAKFREVGVVIRTLVNTPALPGVRDMFSKVFKIYFA
ncbi:MAG: hypothetical protein RRA32_01715 [bacterium]|nr:hypothetical protein [bacterium]